jgi:hypothetical protein
MPLNKLIHQLCPFLAIWADKSKKKTKKEIPNLKDKGQASKTQTFRSTQRYWVAAPSVEQKKSSQTKKKKN